MSLLPPSQGALPQGALASAASAGWRAARDWQPERGSDAGGSHTRRSLAALGFYHRRALLLGFLLPVLVAAGLALNARTSYEVETRLLVLIGRDYVGDGEANALSANLVPDQARAVQTEIEILTSAAVLGEALQQVGPERIFPELARDAAAGAAEPLDRAMQRIGQRLRATALPNSNVVRVHVALADPGLAAELLNRLVEAYLAFRRQAFARVQSGFLDHQRAEAEARLRRLEEQVEAFRRQHGIVDAAQERGAMLARQQELAAQRQAAVTRAGTLEREADSYQRELARTPASVVLQEESIRPAGAEDRRAALRAIEAERGRPQAAADPRLSALRAYGERDREAGMENRRTGRNLQHDQLALELARRTSEMRGVQAAIAGLERQEQAVAVRLAELDAAQTELARLARQVQVEEQSFLDYARRAEEARAREDAAQQRDANVRQIQPAQAPSRGRSLAPSLLAAGVAGGLLLAPAFVFAAARLRHAYLLPGEAERDLARPVLACFWNLARGHRRRARQEARFAAANLVAGNALAHKLLGRLLALRPDGAVLHVAAAPGAEAQAGPILRDLAQAIARVAGQPVLLLDGGTQGVQFRHFGQQGGLREVPMPLLGLAQVDETPLYLADPQRFLGEGRFAPLMQTIRPHFAVTLIDGIGVDDDVRALELAATADAALLVLAAETMPRAAAMEEIRKLEDFGCPVMGTVFAGRKAYVPDALYRLI